MSSSELVRAAQNGDQESLGQLFDEHYAGMRAVAVAILGSTPEAEDACQDAIATALTRIGQVRDPSAMGSWLKAIVRNNCRMILRSRQPTPLGLSLDRLRSVEATAEADDPAQVLERSATRDWLWAALDQLRPTVRTVALLRWFTDANSYADIAALCGLPVGTVRSRLNEARKQLADLLPLVAGAKHPDVAALTAERSEEAAAVLSAIPRGASLASVQDRWSDRARLVWPNDLLLDGLPGLFGLMHSDHRDGVRYRLAGVVAGKGITIWQHDFLNPADDPFHCPPSATWLLEEDDGQIARVRLLWAARDLEVEKAA
ncbi:RNA polymerase sigma factor [Cryptosporangium phraense]|uniref:RNA polymerase sigma factor n=1 Tax=Cryptosporangium phraense TaxID=2593070 RepID=UPI0014784643|nr:sigma-70 family RNA polymerase sigma factor [Cryptosporangium phraense]